MPQIVTIGTNGDYSTLSSWFASPDYSTDWGVGNPATALITGRLVANITINVQPPNGAVIKAAPGEEYDGTNGDYCAAIVGKVLVRKQGIVFKNIMVDNHNESSTVSLGSWEAVDTNIINCGIRGLKDGSYNDGSGIVTYEHLPFPGEIRDVIVERSTSAGLRIRNGNTIPVKNVTVVNSNTVPNGYRGVFTGSPALVTDCVGYNDTNHTCFYNVFDSSSSHLASSDNSAVSKGGVESINGITTDVFADAENGDYRIAKNSVLATAGSDGGAIGALVETDDIIVKGVSSSVTDTLLYTPINTTDSCLVVIASGDNTSPITNITFGGTSLVLQENALVDVSGQQYSVVVGYLLNPGASEGLIEVDGSDHTNMGIVALTLNNVNQTAPVDTSSAIYNTSGMYSLSGTSATNNNGARVISGIISGTPASDISVRNAAKMADITPVSHTLGVATSIQHDAGTYSHDWDATSTNENATVSIAFNQSSINVTPTPELVTELNVDGVSITSSTLDIETTYNQVLSLNGIITSVTTTPVDTAYNRLLALSGSGYSITGNSTNTTYNRVLSLSGNTYNVTDSTIAFSNKWSLALSGAVYNVISNGIDSNNNMSLDVGGYSFNIMDSNIGVTYNRLMSLSGAAYNVNGSNIVALYDKNISVLGGSVSVSNNNISTLYNRVSYVSGDVYALMTDSVDVSADRMLALSGDTITVNTLSLSTQSSGDGPSLSLSGDVYNVVSASISTAVDRVLEVYGCGLSLSDVDIKSLYHKVLPLTFNSYTYSSCDVDTYFNKSTPLTGILYSIQGGEMLMDVPVGDSGVFIMHSNQSFWAPSKKTPKWS